MHFACAPVRVLTPWGSDTVYLDLDSIDGYEEISSRTGPDTNAVIKSTVLGGIGLGLLASSVSSNESAVFAVLLKNGETCTIEVEGTSSVQLFRQTFFTKKGVQKGSGASIARVSGNPDTLLERAFMFLEDGDWSSAETYCESVLDQDPKCARAYLGKLMAELKVKVQEDLTNCKSPFDESDNYRKAIRFGDDSLKQMLTSTVDSINARNEETRLSAIYRDAQKRMAAAQAEQDFERAAQLFESISEYRDAAAQGEKCRDKAEATRKNAILAAGNAAFEKTKSVADYEFALQQFVSVPGWKNADEKAALCQRRMEEVRLETERKKEAQRVAAEAAKKKAKKIAVIAIPIACVAAMLIVLLVNVVIPKIRFHSAVAQIDAGNYVRAYKILRSLDGYENSAELADSIRGEYKVGIIKDVKVGDCLLLGVYEQDKNTSNGKEDIEWLVLDVKGDQALIISKYALDCRAYNTEHRNVTWETCSMRKWLNSEFLETASADAERNIIKSSTVSAGKNLEYGTPAGNNTIDHVFLLSISEADQYFDSDDERICEPTEYAFSKGAHIVGDIDKCQWWLRSPGLAQTITAVVSGQGDVYAHGNVVISAMGVRPAMWINLG